MRRYQLQISVDGPLLEAVRFAAARDGLAPSTKARQILAQQLQRTMASPDFIDHLAYLAGTRTSTSLVYGEQAEDGR